MKKDINYNYINLLLVLGICYLLFLMKDLWIGVVGKIISVIFPFVVAFLISYVLYPFLRFLTSKKIPKTISIFIIILLIFLSLSLILYFALPVFFNQLINLLSNLGKLSNDLASKFNIDTKIVNDTISKYSAKIIEGIGAFISNGTFIGLLNKSVDYITKFIIIFIVSIYFLADMENIRNKIKNFLKEKSKKNYHLLVSIDKEITSYLKGLAIFMIIQFFEYTILFLIIGHPNFLLLGTLACVTTIIPYFGGIITNVIAIIIASVISPRLLILTIIITVIFPNIDGYIISPKIYGKTNQIPPLVTVFSVFACGALFGFIGIVIAVPLTIVIMAIIKSYKNEIKGKIKDVKNKI